MRLSHFPWVSTAAGWWGGNWMFDPWTVVSSLTGGRGWLVGALDASPGVPLGGCPFMAGVSVFGCNPGPEPSIFGSRSPKGGGMVDIVSFGVIRLNMVALRLFLGVYMLVPLSRWSRTAATYLDDDGVSIIVEF